MKSPVPVVYRKTRALYVAAFNDLLQKSLEAPLTADQKAEMIGLKTLIDTYDACDPKTAELSNALNRKHTPGQAPELIAVLPEEITARENRRTVAGCIIIVFTIGIVLLFGTETGPGATVARAFAVLSLWAGLTLCGGSSR